MAWTMIVPDAPPSVLAAVAFAALLVGLSKGGLAMVAMLAVPMLSLVMPPLAAAALLLPIYIASDMVGVWLYRRRFSRRNLAILLPAALIGVAFGWLTAALVPTRFVTFLVGVIGVAFCLNLFLNRARVPEPRPADVPRGLVWGSLSGFTSFVTHAGGPPYQIYMLPQRLDRAVFAGTTTIFFAVVNAAKLVPYIALGQLDLDVFAGAALLVPIGIAGVFLGWWLVRIVPERAFYLFVQSALFLVSLKLVADSILG